jgi:hypothetical protein
MSETSKLEPLHPQQIMLIKLEAIALFDLTERKKLENIAFLPSERFISWNNVIHFRLRTTQEKAFFTVKMPHDLYLQNSSTPQDYANSVLGSENKYLSSREKLGCIYVDYEGPSTIQPIMEALWQMKK